MDLYAVVLLRTFSAFLGADNGCGNVQWRDGMELIEHECDHLQGAMELQVRGDARSSPTNATHVKCMQLECAYRDMREWER